jgi:transketolase
MDWKSQDSVSFSREIRKLCVTLSHEKNTAHLASSLSCVDIVTVLFQSFLNVDISSPKSFDTNRFILSKGHAATTLYSVLFLLNLISKEEIASYARPGSVYEEHPNQFVPFVDFPTGSLGHGLPIGCGLALGNKLQGNTDKVFVLMSDGECNEGTVWESAQFAHTKGLSNLVVLIDHNKFQATGSIGESIGEISLSQAFKGFGWDSYDIDGHDHALIHSVISSSLSNSRPTAVICHTKKGAGVSFMENNNNWHYRSPNATELDQALLELS